jgi:hypothetical protein
LEKGGVEILDKAKETTLSGFSMRQCRSNILDLFLTTKSANRQKFGCWRRCQNSRFLPKRLASTLFAFKCSHNRRGDTGLLNQLIGAADFNTCTGSFGGEDQSDTPADVGIAAIVSWRVQEFAKELPTVKTVPIPATSLSVHRYLLALRTTIFTDFLLPEASKVSIAQMLGKLGIIAKNLNANRQK